MIQASNELQICVNALNTQKKGTPKLNELFDTDRKDLPRRPGREACMNYVRWGTCKFAMQCRFDHPARVKTVDEQVLNELGNSTRYGLMVLRLQGALKVSNAVIHAIDSIFSNASKDKKGQRVINNDSSTAILQAVVDIFMNQVPFVIQDAGSLHSDLTESGWQRYGYEIHYLKVTLPNVGQAVTMAMKHAEMDDYLSSVVVKCFEQMRELVYAKEKDVWTCALDFNDSHAGVDEVLVATERRILQHAHEHSLSMTTAATDRESVRQLVISTLASVINVEDVCSLPGATMTVDAFGSCANTLGTLKSDLDLLVSFYSASGEKLRADDMKAAVTNENIMEMFLAALGMSEDDNSEDDSDELVDTEGKLFRLKDFRGGARVPVIKFFHMTTNIEVDLILSHCNDMALLNTQLIRDYCEVDPRIRPLEFALKRWVSARGVGNSTNSTLSSYCWMLMMIFYLQQVDKESLRVVPETSECERLVGNLQGETEDGTETYTLRAQPSLSDIYAGVMASMPCNADGEWKEGVLSSLSGAGAKRGSISTLLLGFFLYYGTEAESAFGMYDNVACIRKGCRVPKPHVLRDWENLVEGSSPALGSANVANNTVFTTPLKEAAGGGLEGLEESLGQLNLNNQDSAAATTPVSTPRSSRKEAVSAFRSPVCAIPTTTQPFSYKDTPSKMRELLEKPMSGKSMKNGEFPGVVEAAKQWQVSIEDPFELNHDLGSVVRSVIGQNHIRRELRRAVAVLSQGIKGVSIRKDSEGSMNLFDVLCDKNEDVPELPFTCTLCGQEGHREKQCHLFVCHRCGEQGHIAQKCKEAKKTEKCFICGNKGHRKIDCPRLRGGGNGNDRPRSERSGRGNRNRRSNNSK